MTRFETIFDDSSNGCNNAEYCNSNLTRSIGSRDSNSDARRWSLSIARSVSGGGDDVTAEHDNDVVLDGNLDASVVCIGVCIDLMRTGL